MNVERVRALLAVERAPPEVEAILPESAGRWPITRELARFLALLVLEAKPGAILEFGAGASSLLLARALSLAGGGTLTSVEHKPEHARDAWREVERVPTVDARLVVSRLRRRLRGLRLRGEYVDAAAQLDERAPFDLALIDAPQRRYRRDGSFDAAQVRMAPGGLIVLDDAGRADERTSLERWVRRAECVELLVLDPEFGGGKGVGVLAVS